MFAKYRNCDPEHYFGNVDKNVTISFQNNACRSVLVGSSVVVALFHQSVQPAEHQAEFDESQ